MGSPQKVVIPKGLVNPNETTIVEIPKQLQNVGTVVAKVRERPRAYNPNKPQPKLVRKASYMRRSFPGKTATSPAPERPARGQSFGGHSFEKPTEYSHAPWYPKSPRDRYTPDVSIESDLSYGIGKRQGFDPPALLSSTMQDIDYSEGSLYRDFRPQACSPRVGSPGLYPGSMKDYTTSGGEEDPISYYKSTVTTSSPEQESEEVTEEKSYYAYDQPSPEEDEDGCPCSDTSGVYRRYDTIDSSGSSGPPSSPEWVAPDPRNPGNNPVPPGFVYPGTNVVAGGYSTSSSGSPGSYVMSSSGSPGSYPMSSPGSPGPYGLSSSGGSPAGSYRPGSRSPSPGRSMTQADMMNSLGELESSELSRIMGDLNSFQAARRRLVFDASSLASAADVSSSLLNSS